MRDFCAVIGAGPAGLATSRELVRCGVEHVVLERGDQIGHTWHNLYDSLVLHTGKHLSSLPGMPFPSTTPLFPTRLDFLDYLQRYADTFKLPVKTGIAVQSATPDSHTIEGAVSREATAPNGAGWTLHTTAGNVRAQAVVVATGIVSNPHIPEIPGRERFGGAVVHSVTYRRPDVFSGQRVLVVGVGNSAGEISAEVANAGAAVTIAVRSGARVVPRQLLGIPIQYFAAVLNVLPRDAQRAIAKGIARVSELRRGPSMLPPPPEGRCSDIPVIGFHLVDALRAGRIRLKGAVAELTPAGARFAEGSEEPFDSIILATGYRAALDMLGDVIRTDDCGFARRRERVVSADRPGLYFVGHNYDTRGGLRNIALDARLAAEMIAGKRRRV